jgi:DNA polymerase IIIc chi subunit
MTRDDFIHQMTSEAVHSDHFPSVMQRAQYKNQWAVVDLRKILIVCCDTKENAEIAARLWTLSQAGLLNSDLDSRLALIADLK